MNLVSLDIETLAVPELTGFGLVVPNYAVVKVPETLTHNLEWTYIKLPVQDQLDVGLKTDARTMNFWFNVCAREFPMALSEMQKSFNLDRPVVIQHDKEPRKTSNVIPALQQFISPEDKNTKVFGNGCNFDCSILTENHRVLFGEGDLWNYAAPNNIRTLRLLISSEGESLMKEAVQPHLDKFVEEVNARNVMCELQLHNPLYDAAKEALFISFLMDYLKKP